MMFFSKTLENIERFKQLYNDEILHSVYKYISSISVDESDLTAYIEHFKACEKLGLSFNFYYIDSEEGGELLPPLTTEKLSDFLTLTLKICQKAM